MSTTDQRYTFDENEYHYNVYSGGSDDGTGGQLYYYPHDVPLDHSAGSSTTNSIPSGVVTAYHPPPPNFGFPPTPSATTLYTDSNVVARGMRSPKRSPEIPRRVSQVEDQLCKFLILFSCVGKSKALYLFVAIQICLFCNVSHVGPLIRRVSYYSPDLSQPFGFGNAIRNSADTSVPS